MLSLISPDSPYSFSEVLDVPDGHARAGDDRELDGSGETLVTLRIIVLEADLEFDSFEEISLLGLERVLKKALDVGTHSGCGETSVQALRRGEQWQNRITYRL